MARRPAKVWTYTPPKSALPGTVERQEIIAACEALIRDVLKPRSLPEGSAAVAVPSGSNALVDLVGAYAGGRYRFMRRFRSGFDHARGREFDVPFARVDRVEPGRFDVQWMRHTGQWWPLHRGLTLAEALDRVATDPVLSAF